MSNFNNQWIEIFKAGDYGDKGNWPVERVREVVNNFSQATHKPPAVLGHPKHDSPAFGWVAGLTEDGGILKARFEDVHPALENLVSENRYPNRSAAFYLDPEGKGAMLRHVGFLGGAPPEVKGLAPIQFSDGKFVAINFTEEEQVSNQNTEDIKKTVRQSIAEYFSEMFGKKAEAPTFTEHELIAKVESAVQPLVEKVEELEEMISEGQKEEKERASTQDAESRKEKVAAFIEKQKAANRWVPAFDEAGMPQVLENLAAAGGTVEFGEGDDKKKIDAYQVLTTFLEQLPKIVPTKEIAKGARKAGKLISFNEPQRGSNLQVDPASVALAERAEALKPEIRKEYPNADSSTVAGLALQRATAESDGGSASSSGQV